MRNNENIICCILACSLHVTALHCLVLRSAASLVWYVENGALCKVNISLFIIQQSAVGYCTLLDDVSAALSGSCQSSSLFFCCFVCFVYFFLALFLFCSGGGDDRLRIGIAALEAPCLCCVVLSVASCMLEELWGDTWISLTGYIKYLSIYLSIYVLRWN